MVGTCSSSSSGSSFSSFGSFDDVTIKASGSKVKLLCSYGGRILPRYPDGKLRYVGGYTRVLAVDRSLTFSELQVKLGQLCGWGTVSLRCQLPIEDLHDALVSVTSDEDLANLLEEYNLASRDRTVPLKIRAFLLPPSSFLCHPKPSKAQAASLTPINSSLKGNSSAQSPTPASSVLQIPAALRFSGRPVGDSSFSSYRTCRANGSPTMHQCLVHHGNYWLQHHLDLLKQEQERMDMFVVNRGLRTVYPSSRMKA